MKRTVLSFLAAALLLLPASSDAGSGHGWHGGHGFVGHGFHGHGFHGHGFHGHGFHGHGLVGVGPGCCWGPWWWGYRHCYYAPATADYPPAFYIPTACYGRPPSSGWP